MIVKSNAKNNGLMARKTGVVVGDEVFDGKKIHYNFNTDIIKSFKSPSNTP